MFKNHLISVLFFSKYSRNVSELIDLVQTLARWENKKIKRDFFQNIKTLKLNHINIILLFRAV